MDSRRALALARAVELVASAAKSAVEMYIDETAELDERAAALDALEQLKLRDAQIKVAQHALSYRPEETP